MIETPDPRLQTRYLARIVLGLALIASLALAAAWLAQAPVANAVRLPALALLALAMLAIAPLAKTLSERVDEMQLSLHRIASTRSLGWLAGACGAVGVLQLNDLLPAFNQLWTLGAVIALWGLQLMLADRPHH